MRLNAVDVMIVVDLTTFDLVTISVSTAFSGIWVGAMAVMVTVGIGSERQLHPARMFLGANARNADGRAILILGVPIAEGGDTMDSAPSGSFRDRLRFGVAAFPAIHADGDEPGLEVLC